MQAEYVDHMGDDLRVVNAARVSFNKESELEEYEYYASPMDSVPAQGTRLSEADGKLISYLASHGHWTPFAHPQITLREKVPIFVARQRFKHMVGFTYNEVSRRYVSDTPDFYFPSEWRGRPTNGAKQGSSDDTITTASDGRDISSHYDEWIRASKTFYENLLADGVAPEQARVVLPQSMYTEYYVTGSLAAWARAYKQRIDAHAQKEIQELAVMWGDIIAPHFPASWEALTCS